MSPLKRVEPGRWPGSWRVHRQFETWMECLITADPALGTGGDPSTAQVYVRNSSPRFLHLMTFEGQIDPFEFARRLHNVSLWCKMDERIPAMIACEDDGLGVSVTGKLRDLRARQMVDPRTKRVGYHTGPAGWAVPFDNLIRAELEDIMEFNDRRTVIQLRALQHIRSRSGEIVPAFPEPDDPKARRDPEISKSGDLVKTAAMAAQILLTQRSRTLIDTTVRGKAEGALVSHKEEMAFWRKSSARNVHSTWQIGPGMDMRR